MAKRISWEKLVPRFSGMIPRFKDFLALSPTGYVKVGYLEWGPENATRTVICAHGLSRNCRDFDVLAQRLAGQGLRVICPDLPGRGRSDWLDRPEDYDTQFYISCLSALIARIGVHEVDWIGSSLGGFIGMNIASLPNTPIRRFVINDFGARITGSALKRIGSYVSVERRFDKLSEVEVHLRKVHAPFGPLNDDQWAHIVQHSAVMMDDGSYRLHYDPNIAHQLLWPIMLDLVIWDVWEKVDMPVLVLRGKQSDLLQEKTAIEMTKRGIAASKGWVNLIEFEDCGHAPSLILDDHMEPILEFLLAENFAEELGDEIGALG